MSNTTLTSEQVAFFTDLLKSFTTSQISSAMKEHVRGRSYRSDRGKAERLSAKLARNGELSTSDITSINKIGLVGWYRSR